MTLFSNRVRQFAFSSAVLAGSLTFSSCSSSGFRRTYVAVGPAGDQMRLSGDDPDTTGNNTVFDDDLEIHAIGELVSGRDNEEITCRWNIAGTGLKFDSSTNPNFRSLGGNSFLFVTHPGKTTSGTNIDNYLRQAPTEGGAAPSWGFSGKIIVQWVIDGDEVASNTFFITPKARSFPAPK